MAKVKLTIKEVAVYDWIHIYDVGGKPVVISREDEGDEEKIIIKYNASDFHINEGNFMGVVAMTRAYPSGTMKSETLEGVDATMARKIISQMFGELNAIHPVKPEFKILLPKEKKQ